VVRCLLIEPNPESALNEEAGRMFMEDYQSYAQVAFVYQFPFILYYSRARCHMNVLYEIW